MLWASLLSPLVFCSTSQQLLHGRPGVLPNISLLVGRGVCGRSGGGTQQGSLRLAAPGLAPGGRRHLFLTCCGNCFLFLAAAGDAEADGGVSDSIQTSKLTPIVVLCIWSSPHCLTAPDSSFSTPVPGGFKVPQAPPAGKPQASTVSLLLTPNKGDPWLFKVKH